MVELYGSVIPSSGAHVSRRKHQKWSGWQELNLRGHVPKTCGWPLPYTRIWWLGTELNRIHWLFRPALCRRVPEPNLVDGARLELAFHGCRPWVIPLYEPPIWGEMRESNSRDWSHNPVPKPFGQSRHQTWSWSSESNTRRRGTSSLHCHCARPANLWSWHAASNCGRALTMRLLFPLSYTSGAGAAIRTPITDLRGPRSSH